MQQQPVRIHRSQGEKLVRGMAGGFFVGQAIAGLILIGLFVWFLVAAGGEP